MPKDSQANQRARDARRDQIVAAALELFATRGLAATKITDIAAAAQISQGLMYHYFRSKEEIFVELIRDAFAKMNAAARTLEEHPATPREKIIMAVSQLLRDLEQSERFARTILLITQASISAASPAQAVAIIEAQRDEPYQVVARIMRAGQRDGSVRDHDADALALIFWTTIKGLALHRASVGAAFVAPDPRILTHIFLTME